MSDETRGPEDDFAEEPVAEIAALREEASERFLLRIRSSINRRRLASESLDLSFSALARVFMLYLSMLFESVTSIGEKERRDER